MEPIDHYQAGNLSDAIADVKVAKNLVMLTRGSAELDDTFTLESTYFGLGRAVLDGFYGPGSARATGNDGPAG